MSSHILQEIEATVDRIIIIDKGEIVADGSTKKLINQHTSKKKQQRPRKQCFTIRF